MKPRIVSDTSFLVSLSIIGMGKNLLKFFDVKITPEVLNELKNVARYKDAEGKAAKKILRFVERRVIDVVPVKVKKIQGLGRGESSVLFLFVKEKFDFLACDDFEAIPKIAKKIGEDKILVTYDILEVFLRKQILSKQRTNALIRKLLQLRHWDLSKSMLEAAKKRKLI
jgi:predicted nucleic acid-binding protein